MCSRENIKQPPKLSKNPNCSACNLQFFIKDFTLNRSKCPFLLHCGHSICQFCLQQNLNDMSCVSCRQCGYTSALECTDQTSNSFPLNIYVTGSLVIHKNYRYEQERRFEYLACGDGNFSYSIKGQSNLTESSSIKCDECSLIGSWFCENCDSYFCEMCWSNIHSSAKSLMKHVKHLLSNNENIRNVPRKCPNHDNQSLEFYCKGCCTAVCPHCVILEHQGDGHSLVILGEKNAEMIEEVKTAAKDAEMMREKMQQTLEKINRTLNSSDFPENRLYLDLENQITKNFERLHGILQLEEERLLKKVYDKANERENRLKAFSAQLESYVKDIAGLIKESQIFLESPQSLTYDVTDLHKMLLGVKNLPYFLTSERREKTEIKIVFNNALIDSLRNFCTLDIPSDESLELLSSEDLPEDCTGNPVFQDPLENGKILKQDSTVPELGSLNNGCAQYVGKEKVDMPVKIFKAPNIFYEGRNYSVRLCYIKNPGEFYITLNSQRVVQEEINKKANQFGNHSFVLPKTLMKDEIYLVKYDVDKNWYRGRVTEVLSKNSPGEVDALVHYLDYGNREIVPISRIRPIPAELLEEGPLAVKCKLFECVPRNKDWCTESTKAMEKMFENSVTTMFVMKVHPDCLEVDLSKICSEGQIGKDIISVRDALVFLELAHLVGGVKSVQNPTAIRYLSQCIPSIGESFEAIITHANSPSDFYAQRAEQDIIFAHNLSCDLQKYYNEHYHKNIIYNPVIGMPCAALFSEDKKWYRAKIIDIPGRKKITVFYVDYGNTETVSWAMVRKLKCDFVKRPPLALHCSLAGIKPNSGHWNPQAISYIRDKEFCIFIQGKAKSREELKVVMYKKNNAKEICMNTLFVDMGYAVTCNYRSSWLNNGEDDISEHSKCDLGETDAPTKKNKLTTSKAEGFISRKKPFKREQKKKNKLSARELRESHTAVKKDFLEVCSLNENKTSIHELDKCDHGFKAKIEVLSAESPSSIYVIFPALTDALNKMQSQMNEFYDSTTEESLEWAVESKCAAFCPEVNSWYRASILSILPDKKFKVFLMDRANVVTVSGSCLRELDPSFLKYPTCAVKCHLSDISPPSHQWPSVSCEFLSSELENYSDVYMTRKGEIVDKSLPVELWVEKVSSGGALEPNTKQWITLNQLLIDQGLAVPFEANVLYSEIAPNLAGYADNEKCAKAEINSSGTPSTTEEPTEMPRTSESIIPFHNVQWLPPGVLKNSCFIGMPTYVDLDANIYIYDIEQDEEKLHAIKKALLEEYENSKPTADDNFWTPGEICIAQYHNDECWYRGVVLKMNENLTYEVLFVDYGNVETCETSNLRKRIKMSEIPILTRKFRLQGIAPVSGNGTWPAVVIEILHSLVVDKKCEVILFSESLDPSEPSIISLKVIELDGMDVGSFLVDEGFAHIEFNSVSPSESSAEDLNNQPYNFGTSELENKDNEIPESFELQYISLRIPENLKGVFVKIRMLETDNEVFATINDDELLSPNIKQLLKEFENLEQNLTEECSSRPYLQTFLIGQPCCCLDPVANKWFRGEIQGFTETEDVVDVFYVDYGFKKLLNKNLLCEFKPQWFRVPKMAVKLRLSNVKMCPTVTESDYQKALTECLKEGSFYAEIISDHEEVLDVSLLTNRKGSLAYQDLIDKGIMKFM